MATIELIYVITISSLLSFSRGVNWRHLYCCGCFGGRQHQDHKEETKIHPMGNTLTMFDNSLQRDLEQDPLDWVVNYSYSRQLSSRPTSPSPTSPVVSLMNLHANETGSDVHTIAAPAIATDTLPDNITWFDIDSHYITQNSTVIKSNMNIYLINIIMYEMTHVLYFLGHYLPLQNNQAIATQFQLIFDYFAQFQYGVNSVNLRNMVNNYESIRHKAIHLLTIENSEESLQSLNIPSHVVDFEAKSSLSKIYRHRARMMRAHLAPRVRTKLHSEDDTTYSTISSLSRHENHFWNTDWLRWDKKPLHLSGCHPNETHHFNQMLLLRVCYELDKVHKIITGYDDHDKSSGINSIRDQFRFRKSADIFLKSFYNESIVMVTSEYAIKRYASLGHKQKKLIMGLRHAATIGICNFVLSSSTNKQRRKRSKPKFKLHLMGIKSSMSFYSQIAFDVALFDGHRRFKSYMIVINQYLTDLLQDKKTADAVKFTHIQNRGGVLFLLNVILQYTLVGGRCGYAFDAKDEGYQASIICEVSILDIDEEGSNAQINKKLKIPRRFMEKGNNTDDYWIVLKNFTGLNFEDIDHVEDSWELDSSEDMEGIMDGYTKTPRWKKGITIEDLQMHNWEMKHKEDVNDLVNGV
eukprot:6580_1